MVAPSERLGRALGEEVAGLGFCEGFADEVCAGDGELEALGGAGGVFDG